MERRSRDASQHRADSATSHLCGIHPWSCIKVELHLSYIVDFQAASTADLLQPLEATI